MTRCIELRTTLGSRAAAEELAEAMVAARLAAWAEEWTCSFKTTRAAQPALEAAVLARHPYQLPEIVAAPLEGSAAYLGWIEQSVFTGEG